MATQLHAGAATSNITPKLGVHMQGYLTDRLADDIADELFAKAIVLRNDDTALAIVVCDLIACYQEHVDIARARAAALTGIPAENILIAATHTHYGPVTMDIAGIPQEKAYTEWAMEKAADAVKLAWNRLRPARVGHASGSCPEETHNRRWHMKDGAVRMNPGFQNPDMLRPAGPADPEAAIMVVVEKDSERPIAAMANYSLHYVGSPAANTISANYFGAFSRALQRLGGGDFVAMMANGCCGDINNCDFTRPAPPMPHPQYQCERVGNVVAARVYAAWQQIRDFDATPVLGAARRMVPFRRRESTPAELDAARQTLPKKSEVEYIKWLYAMEALEVAKEPVVQPAPVVCMRVGDLGIASLPGEIFADYGLKIKAQSPFARTMTVELANGCLGYCPTDAAIQEGGYETWLCRWAKVAPGTEGQMVGTAGELLHELHRR